MLTCINNHEESISYYIISSTHHGIILGLHWLHLHNPDINWKIQSLLFSDPDCSAHLVPHLPSVPVPASVSPVRHQESVKIPVPTLPTPDSSVSHKTIPASTCAPPVRICFLGASSFMHAAKGRTIYSLTMTPIPDDQPKQTILPNKYASFRDVFDKAKATSLLEHRSYDCTIDLQPGTTPPWGPIYGLSEPETKVLQDYIKDNLANGFI